MSPKQPPEPPNVIFDVLLFSLNNDANGWNPSSDDGTLCNHCKITYTVGPYGRNPMQPPETRHNGLSKPGALWAGLYATTGKAETIGQQSPGPCGRGPTKLPAQVGGTNLTSNTPIRTTPSPIAASEEKLVEWPSGPKRGCHQLHRIFRRTTSFVESQYGPKTSCRNGPVRPKMSCRNGPVGPKMSCRNGVSGRK